MTDIEKIKAEIERQIKEECLLDTYEGRCKSCWANTLLTFVNSLIEEQPQGLDEAAENYLKHHIIGGGSKPEVSVLANFGEAAFKAGAMWRESQILGLPDNLEDAAFEYSTGRGITAAQSHAMSIDFKAGAKWMAEQGETHNTIIWKDEDDQLFIQEFVKDPRLKMADNVIVQIRKK